MLPTMVQFKAALSAPALHFKRLKQAEPLLCNELPIVQRTHSVVESEISVNGRRFLLFLPRHSESIRHIEELEQTARERTRGPLLENHILYEELIFVDSLGHKQLFDVVLQEQPQGILLREAINRYRADDLRAAVIKMKKRLDAIGFCHKNLTPSNVIICNSGVARPLRYWYAEWELFSNNDISKLLDLIDRNCNHELDERLPRLLVEDCGAEYSATASKQDAITCRCKGHKYGFVDADGHKITDYIYSSASEFREGRAIVSKNNKVGVIDSNGKSVLPIIYESVEFDIERGLFIATNDKNIHLLDYNGDRITVKRKDE